jgi:hypothetical protein
MVTVVKRLLRRHRRREGSTELGSAACPTLRALRAVARGDRGGGEAGGDAVRWRHVKQCTVALNIAGN